MHMIPERRLYRFVSEKTKYVIMQVTLQLA